MFDSSSFDYSFVTDQGPIYHETMPGRLIVEPWNAFSSLLYLIPAIIFLINLRGHYGKYTFLIYFAIPLLFLGGTGSTFYHAFRTWRWMMFLDVMPIFILTMGVSAYFMYKLFHRWWIVAFIIILFLFLRSFSFGRMDLQTAINISYLSTGLIIFIPAICYAYSKKWQFALYLSLAAILLGVSLFFRYFDDFPNQFMKPGTHWLWHLFSAAGAMMLGLYLFKTADPLKRKIH